MSRDPTDVTEQQVGEEGDLRPTPHIICRQCGQEFAHTDEATDYAEGCRDPDCPMQEHNQ